MGSDETTSAGADFYGDIEFVTREEATAEIADVGPDALSTWARDENFQRTVRFGGNGSALAGDTFNTQSAATRSAPGTAGDYGL